MGICDVCGNRYDKSFDIVQGGRRGTYDSFECAIHALAPRCSHCQCSIIGHGAEHDGKFYCCAHCAKQSGIVGIDDRV